MHANSGYRGEATALSRRFAGVFDGYEAVVSPSSSCVGMVRHVYPELAREAGDKTLARALDDLVPRIFELSELLVNRLGVTDVGASLRRRVTYHATCHSLRVARVGEAPFRLLEAVQGLEHVPLPGATEMLRVRWHLRDWARLRRRSRKPAWIAGLCGVSGGGGI
jgi:L-lactate dehydrogenase complex protein LldE